MRSTMRFLFRLTCRKIPAASALQHISAEKSCGVLGNKLSAAFLPNEGAFTNIGEVNDHRTLCLGDLDRCGQIHLCVVKSTSTTLLQGIHNAKSGYQGLHR